MDFDLETKPDKDFIFENINKLIKQNHKITISSITEEYLSKNPQLVRTMAVQPPKGSGKIRMILIGKDIDYQGATDVEFNAFGDAAGAFKELEVSGGKFVTMGAL